MPAMAGEHLMAEAVFNLITRVAFAFIIYTLVSHGEYAWAGAIAVFVLTGE